MAILAVRRSRLQSSPSQSCDHRPIFPHWARQAPRATDRFAHWQRHSRHHRRYPLHVRRLGRCRKHGLAYGIVRPAGPNSSLRCLSISCPRCVLFRRAWHHRDSWHGPYTYLVSWPGTICSLRHHRMVTVGTAVASRPPYRSRRALLTHRAPPSGFGVEAVTG